MRSLQIKKQEALQKETSWWDKLTSWWSGEPNIKSPGKLITLDVVFFLNIIYLNGFVEFNLDITMITDEKKKLYDAIGYAEDNSSFSYPEEVSSYLCFI